jgi:hypothetical protein
LVLQPLAVEGGDGRADFPKLHPGGVSLTGLFLMAGGNVQGLTAAVVAEGQVHMGTMTLRRIPVTDAALVAAASSGFREATLDHYLGGLEEALEELFLTHMPS